MKTGPFKPVSTGAMLSIAKISEVLLKEVPADEWSFVLKQAEDVAKTKRHLNQ